MNEAVSERAEFEALNREYETYIRGLRTSWLAEHRPQSSDVLEVMRPHDREQVDRCISDWGRYVTPLGEAWWRERGFKIVSWPTDNSQPMLVQKLEAVEA